MPAYCVLAVTLENEDWIPAYLPKANALVAKHGGSYLARQRPIHLGFQSGADFLIPYLRELHALEINHVALNLRFIGAGIGETMKCISGDVMPEFEE